MSSGKGLVSKDLPILLAVTGASGAIYALKFMELASSIGVPVHLILSEAGKKVAGLELGPSGLKRLQGLAVQEYYPDDLMAPPASGSSQWASMVVLPCTMGTLSAVAHGASRNLIHRACDCFLKERRPLVLCVRETPFNAVHLENMRCASLAGAVIYPCMPSFYHRPDGLGDMAAFFSGRILDFLGYCVDGLKRWGSGKG